MNCRIPLACHFERGACLFWVVPLHGPRYFLISVFCSWGNPHLWEEMNVQDSKAEKWEGTKLSHLLPWVCPRAQEKISLVIEFYPVTVLGHHLIPEQPVPSQSMPPWDTAQERRLKWDEEKRWFSFHSDGFRISAQVVCCILLIAVMCRYTSVGMHQRVKCRLVFEAVGIYRQQSKRWCLEGRETVMEKKKKRRREVMVMGLALTNALIIRLCCLKINNISIAPFIILHTGISEVIILVHSPSFIFFYKLTIMISHVNIYFSETRYHWIFNILL